ncbi:MAG TPA: hypothetical protein VF553_22345 [Pyrinomonadaceae bacterium]|jgi:hypothetical protein
MATTSKDTLHTHNGSLVNSLKKGKHIVKNIIAALLLVAAGLAVAAGYNPEGAHIQSAHPQINIKDIPEQGLAIIGPADTAFNSMVESLLKGEGDPVLEALRPFSICIKNRSRRTVVAFTLKWQLMREDGTIRTKTIDYIELWRLMGISSSGQDSYTIQPDSAFFAIPSVEFPLLPSSVDGQSTALTAAQASTLDAVRAELSQYTNITVTLDGAFFDDGLFVGPDGTGFFEKVVAKRNAKRDLILQIKQDLRQGKSTEQTYNHLEELANGADVNSNSNSTGDSYYARNKKAAAADILRMRDSVGSDRAIEATLKQMREPVPELRKN